MAKYIKLIKALFKKRKEVPYVVQLTCPKCGNDWAAESGTFGFSQVYNCLECGGEWCEGE